MHIPFKQTASSTFNGLQVTCEGRRLSQTFVLHYVGQQTRRFHVLSNHKFMEFALTITGLCCFPFKWRIPFIYWAHFYKVGKGQPCALLCTVRYSLLLLFWSHCRQEMQYFLTDG